MNLKKKKTLAARVLEVGRDRITFIQSRLSEIKEAITKQDIRDLHRDGAIIVKEISGRRKKEKRLRKRSYGHIKKKINKRKENYVVLTRKLRRYIEELKDSKKISKEEGNNLRKKIKGKMFKSKTHFKEHLRDFKKVKKQ